MTFHIQLLGIEGEEVVLLHELPTRLADLERAKRMARSLFEHSRRAGWKGKPAGARVMDGPATSCLRRRHVRLASGCRRSLA
jgi:hypothetical protein